MRSFVLLAWPSMTVRNNCVEVEQSIQNMYFLKQMLKILSLEKV